ncbi:transposase, partial [filamentous cyanobacterium CCP1]
MSGVPHIEIHESAEELKDLMHQQRQADDRERIQALYLLKSGQCQQVQQVAKVIGRHRSTVHRWLDFYRTGGVNRLLDP